MKTLLIFILMFCQAFAIKAQQVVASSGNTATAGGYSVAWTLGEPVIATLTGSTNILTQGMHQTNLVATDVGNVVFPGLEVKVYPNPTGDFLTVEVIRKENELLQLELTDIAGRRVILKKVLSGTEEIDMRSYVPGVYLVHIFNSGREHVKICKIVKN